MLLSREWQELGAVWMVGVPGDFDHPFRKNGELPSDCCYAFDPDSGWWFTTRITKWLVDLRKFLIGVVQPPTSDCSCWLGSFQLSELHRTDHSVRRVFTVRVPMDSSASHSLEAHQLCLNQQ